MPMTLCTRALQRAWATIMPLALLAASGTCAAQQVQRCESPDGKVTYSNTKCPDGTTPVRSVNTSPPVAVDEQKAAKERARRDAAEVKAIDKARAKDCKDGKGAKQDQMGQITIESLAGKGTIVTCHLIKERRRAIRIAKMT